MWKIVAAFIAFAALSMFVIMQGGDNLDMSGEKHGTEGTPTPATPATPAAPTTPTKP